MSLNWPFSPAPSAPDHHLFLGSLVQRGFAVDRLCLPYRAMCPICPVSLCRLPNLYRLLLLHYIHTCVFTARLIGVNEQRNIVMPCQQITPLFFLTQLLKSVIKEVRRWQTSLISMAIALPYKQPISSSVYSPTWCDQSSALELALQLMA